MSDDDDANPPPDAERTLTHIGPLSPEGSPAARFTPGNILNARYRIVAPLGSGGAGEVYRAEDMKLGQTVALKFVSQRIAHEKSLLKRILAEVRVGREVSHPNLCRIYDMDEINDQYFITMEYVDGENLASLLRRVGRLPEDKALEVAREICAGLAAIHDRDVVHRDLKPSNIMIDGRGHARITDFGLAILSGQTAAESFAGTPAYMAPEQLEGAEATEQSDIYSLGLLLYEVFTGQRFFTGTLNEIVTAHQKHKRAPSMITPMSPAIERVILQCIEESPVNRPESVRHVLAALPGGGDPLHAAPHSILVLPFENVTGDRDLDYLCDGVAENVINAFSRVTRFRVLSPRTAFRWKGSSAEPEAIGRELQVETVIHGRLTAAMGRLTIQVDAVQVATGTQIWGNRFHAEADQVFRVEEEVAAEVVDALQLRLSADDLSRLAHRYTSNAHAYDLYLRGRFQWNKRTEDGLQKAVEHFERAIVADPKYALPHAGIADAYVAIGSRDLMPPRETFARALEAATRALELAPGLAEGHASLAAIAEVHQWNWSEAGRKYRRAIELSPSSTAYQWYALHFARQKLFEEAEVQMAKALDHDPLSIIVLTNAALIPYLARDSEMATERIERAFEVEPDDPGALLLRGSIHELRGDLDAAIEDYRRAVGRSSRHAMSLGMLGHALGKRGVSTGAEEILQRFDKLRHTHHVSAFAPALVTLGLGRIDEVFEWLEAALAEKSGWLVYLKTDPRLDPLRGDVRFGRLLEAVDLA